MRLLFKQRFFSWLDSYDVFDESGAAVFRVRGEISFGHKLRIYDAAGQEAGLVKEKVFCWLPQFELYAGGQYIGRIRKKWSFLRPKYLFDCNGWSVEGNFLEWDYQILRQDGTLVAKIGKQIWNWTDTYVIDVADPRDALPVLMFVLAVDAEKCSRN